MSGFYIPALRVSTNYFVTTTLDMEVDSDHCNDYFDVAAVAKSTNGRCCHGEHELYLQRLMLGGTNAIFREENVSVTSSHDNMATVLVAGHTIVCIVCALMIR